MKDYSDNVPWSAVLIAFAQLAVVIAVMAVVYLVTRVTPEREAELKAQGAAEADSKAAAAGGWSAWIAGEVSADGRDARRPSVASADARRVGYVAGATDPRRVGYGTVAGASRPGETEVR